MLTALLIGVGAIMLFAVLVRSIDADLDRCDQLPPSHKDRWDYEHPYGPGVRVHRPYRYR